MVKRQYKIEDGQPPVASEPVVAWNQPTFTPAQVEVLNAVAHLHTEEEVRGLKQAISNYFAKLADAEMERLWEKGVINEDVMNGWEHEHMRTPYRSVK